MGNTVKQCRLILFQDSDFAGDLEDSKSTSGGTLCIFGSHTFVPISWMCKKQTSVSHSSIESDIIFLDTELRLDDITALDLCYLIVVVLGWCGLVVCVCVCVGGVCVWVGCVCTCGWGVSREKKQRKKDQAEKKKKNRNREKKRKKKKGKIVFQKNIKKKKKTQRKKDKQKKKKNSEKKFKNMEKHFKNLKKFKKVKKVKSEKTGENL